MHHKQKNYCDLAFTNDLSFAPKKKNKSKIFFKHFKL